MGDNTAMRRSILRGRLRRGEGCMVNGGNLQRGPQLPFKSEYAQRNGWAGEVRKWIERKTDMAQITVADEEVL